MAFLAQGRQQAGSKKEKKRAEEGVCSCTCRFFWLELVIHFYIYYNECRCLFWYVVF